LSVSMTVLHLETGHVLAAVSSGREEPTVADLTGGEHLLLRPFDRTSFVEVPDDVLTATRVALDRDVLDRPLHHVVDTGATPPVSLGVAPSSSVGSAVGLANGECLTIWQTPGGAEVSRVPLDATGAPPPTSAKPAGATARLVAWDDGPLVVEAV
jgi:hypothetical protein